MVCVVEGLSLERRNLAWDPPASHTMKRGRGKRSVMSSYAELECMPRMFGDVYVPLHLPSAVQGGLQNSHSPPGPDSQPFSTGRWFLRGR